MATVSSGITLSSLANLLDPSAMLKLAAAIETLTGMLAADSRVVVTISTRVNPQREDD